MTNLVYVVKHSEVGTVGVFSNVYSAIARARFYAGQKGRDAVKIGHSSLLNRDLGSSPENDQEAAEVLRSGKDKYVTYEGMGVWNSVAEIVTMELEG